MAEAAQDVVNLCSEQCTLIGSLTLMKIRTSREAVPRRDARCTIKMGRLARRYRGGTKAGRAMSDKNGTFEKHITRRYRGGTEAGRALYDKNGTI
jgi:hypothetical protein